MLTKHKWLNYLVIAALVGIVVSAVLQVLTPSSPKIPATDIVTQNVDETSGNFEGVVFTGRKPELPEKLPIFQIKTQSSAEQKIIQQLIEEYGLQQHETRETLWASQSYTLSLNQQEQQIILAQIPEEGGRAQPGISLEPALSTAQNFVDKVLLEENFQAFSNDVKYLSGSYHLTSAEPENATLVEIPFSHQLDSRPAFTEQQESWPVTVIVNGNGEIIKAVLTTRMYNFEKSFEAQAITIDEALENINEKNLGSLINIFQKQFEPVSLAKISSGKLGEVVVEYRIDEGAQLSYPVYKFTGEFEGAGDNYFRGQLLTPAIPAEDIR